MEFAQIRAISLGILLTLQRWPGTRHSFQGEAQNQSQIESNLPIRELPRERDVDESRVQIVINDPFAAPPSRTRSG